MKPLQHKVSTQYDERMRVWAIDRGYVDFDDTKQRKWLRAESQAGIGET